MLREKRRRTLRMRGPDILFAIFAKQFTKITAFFYLLYCRIKIQVSDIDDLRACP